MRSVKNRISTNVDAKTIAVKSSKSVQQSRKTVEAVQRAGAVEETKQTRSIATSVIDKACLKGVLHKNLRLAKSNLSIQNGSFIILLRWNSLSGFR